MLIQNYTTSKMARIIVILLVCLFSYSCVQTNDKDITTNIDTIASLEIDTMPINHPVIDTVFIYRKVTRDYYHAIYIDTIRTSKYYTYLKNFNFDKYAKESYQSAYQYKKELYVQQRKNEKSIDLPKNWLPIYQYKNEYYLYAPSDWGNAHRCLINDSSFVNWDMEGPVPYPLKSFTRIAKNKYKLEFLHKQNNHVASTKLIIHVIEPVTNLSVFEFLQEAEQPHYELYVPAEHAEKFNLIVNYCNNQKQIEFNFDKIDFKQILNNRR
jgi:hypothetical protein